MKKPQKTSIPNKSYLPGSRVKTSWRKHLFPPLMGLLAAALVLGLFNSQIIVAQLSALTFDAPASVAVQDKALAAGQPDPAAPSEITINAVDVKTPIIFDEKSVDEASLQRALRGGVVHYPNTALPGQSGNVVIFGHSSGQVWTPGDYKFVFTHLDKLQKDAKIFVNYQGIRYVYAVEGKDVVPPTDVSVLEPSADNILTLITCTPVGTNTDRLIITARQISPQRVASPPQATSQADTQSLPGHTPSTLDALQSIFN